MGFTRKGCYTKCDAPAPNPDPSRWVLLGKIEFTKSYVLVVQYLDATNFEGKKIMVFNGKYKHRDYLDPHFFEGEDSPVARFKPDTQGLVFARIMAAALSALT